MSEPVKPFTSGECARLLQVAPRTVSKWIDRGLLVGHRLPDSGDRRVYHADLMAFMDRWGFEVPHELRPLKVLWCGPPDSREPALENMVFAAEPEEVGEAVVAVRPVTAVVYATTYTRSVALRLVRFLADRRVGVVVVPTEDDDADLPWLNAGADAVVPYPGISADVRDEIALYLSRKGVKAWPA